MSRVLVCRTCDRPFEDPVAIPDPASLDAELLAEALWFEGLLSTATPSEPAALESASSLLGAIEGLRRHHRAARLRATGREPQP